MHAEVPLWQVSSNWFIHVLYSIYIQNMVDESGGEYSVYRRAGSQLGPVGEEVGGGERRGGRVNRLTSQQCWWGGVGVERGEVKQG